MKISEAFPSQYIKTEDLKGRKAKLVISGIGAEEIGQERDERVCLSFAGQKKRLPLNKTNAMAIAAGHGDDTDTWIGKEIILVPSTVLFQGKMTPCIKVEVEGSQPAMSEDNVPF